MATTLITLYVISAMTAALGGWMLAGYLWPVLLRHGEPYLFISITAVLVGGVSLLGGSGNYLGTFAGTLILTILGALLAILNLVRRRREDHLRHLSCFSRRSVTVAEPWEEELIPCPR